MNHIYINLVENIWRFKIFAESPKAVKQAGQYLDL